MIYFSAIELERKHKFVTELVNSINSRCRRWNYPNEFSSAQEFYFFIHLNDDFDRIFRNWIDANYARPLRPSADRIDARFGYTKRNIQFITYRENMEKAKAESALFNGVPIIALSMDMKPIRRFASVNEASRELAINRKSIWRVLNGRNGHTHKMRFRYLPQGKVKHAFYKAVWSEVKQELAKNKLRA